MVRDLITFSAIRRALLNLVPLLVLIFSDGVAHADVLDMPAPSNPPATLPTTGMTMDQVAAIYGDPDTRHETVSNPGTEQRPPINRWDYPRFSVIFERDRVIHSVSPQHPPEVISH